MTEPSDQPLLAEPAAEPKKPARKRTTKPASAATKTVKAAKPAAKKTVVKKTAVQAVEAPPPESPAAPETAVVAVAQPAETPAPASPTAAPVPPPGADEWSPSRTTPAPAAPAPAPAAAATPTPAPTAPVVKQRPVYIPLHVARQMEEQARAGGRTDAQAPLSVPADQAARMDLPLPTRSERAELPPREDEIRRPR